MPVTNEIIQVPVEELHFDRHNPRLAEYGIEDGSTDEQILTTLWTAMDVMELVQSIAASGFFPHEALIATEENGKKVVIEGNRRLAAVKVLLHPQLAKDNGWEIPKASKEVLATLQTLPAIMADRQESWRFLGFKHVNGPAKWTSYAKAAYIAQVHRKFKVKLDEIAEQIGDRHRTVQRLYRALMVLEQAEKQKVYDREDRWNKQLAFSHLYTGLDYDGIAEFLEIAPKESETPNPIPKGKSKELGELLVWLYGSKKAERSPLVESQNPHLRQLNAAVSNRESLAALRSGVALSKAFEISQPPAILFENALLSAKRSLTDARAYLTEGDDGTEAQLRMAGTIGQLAQDIYEEMERKRAGRSTKRKFLTQE